MIGIETVLSIVGMVLTLVATLGVTMLSKMNGDIHILRTLIEKQIAEHHDHILDTEARMGRVETISAQHETRLVDVETRLLAHMLNTSRKTGE